jgi:hypothetical protein
MQLCIPHRVCSLFTKGNGVALLVQFVEGEKDSPTLHMLQILPVQGQRAYQCDFDEKVRRTI